MEFEIVLEEVTNEIEKYNKIINAIAEYGKEVDKILGELMDTSWSGDARDQFKENTEMWQKQLGKILEDAETINKDFYKILNLKTNELQKRSDGFIDCIRK